MPGERLQHLQRFYGILGRLAAQEGGVRRLARCDGRMRWPGRGVYFFFEEGEMRSDSGEGMRVVRVGTHALKAGSQSSLWGRLSQHRGVGGTGGGNHRGSVFRLHVGTAIVGRHPDLRCASWGIGGTAPRNVRELEQTLEQMVSEIVRAMPILWIGIEDEPGPNSERGYLERNAIGLLSNYRKLPLDPPSDNWLGRHCASERVRASGLWNSNHVDEAYDPAFLDRLEGRVAMAAAE